MSMALAAYAVPDDLAARILGARSRAVINRLLRPADRFSSADEYIRQQVEDGNWDEDAPPVETVLRDMVYGRPVDPRWGFQWALVSEAACSALGERLPNTEFSPMRSGWVDELDRAVELAGIGEGFVFSRHLINRGLVLRIPETKAASSCTDIAGGFLTAAEVRKARRAFDRGRYSELRHEERHSLGMIRGWLAVCETLDRGLATFYS